MIRILGQENTILNNFIAEIRDEQIQKDPLRFRRNLERMGEIMAYEISKTLDFETKEVQTPLGVSNVSVISSKIVLGTILRAGLPLHHGMLNYFDRAENAIISAYRKHSSEKEFDIQVEYMSSPSLEGKILLLSDPMLATGMSMVASYRALVQHYGVPLKTHIVSTVASEQGLEYVRRNMPTTTKFWLGAVDPEMNAKSYIVPGLGDAGDLAFGVKQ